MPRNDKDASRPGRPPKSPEGKREVIHLSLSPEAAKKVKRLCDRPISPISTSAMIEHLIMEAKEPFQTPV